jgi:hypothetical protein
MKLKQTISSQPNNAPSGVWLKNGDLFRSLGIKVGGA